MSVTEEGALCKQWVEEFAVPLRCFFVFTALPEKEIKVVARLQYYQRSGRTGGRQQQRKEGDKLTHYLKCTRVKTIGQVTKQESRVTRFPTSCGTAQHFCLQF